MNLSKIVVGDVNIVGGSPNLDVRVIDVQSGEVTGRDGATFAWTNYRSTMQQLAQKVAGQIGVVYGGNVSNKNVQSTGKSPSGKVETLLGYLQVFPEDLGSYNGCPNSVITAINRQTLYDFGDWRLPTNEELSLMATAKTKLGMSSISSYMSQENANLGETKIVRLVRVDDGIGSSYGTPGANNTSHSNMPTANDLKKAGFRFLKDWASRSVSVKTENGKISVISNAFPNESDDIVTECYGGSVSTQGVLNGLVIIKGTYSDGTRCSSLAYICEGKMTYPILCVTSYESDGFCIALEEGIASYGCYCPHWDGYRHEGMCGLMRDVFGRDFSNQNVLKEIYYGTIDLKNLEKSFISFLISGYSLNGLWTVDGFGYGYYYE